VSYVTQDIPLTTEILTRVLRAGHRKVLMFPDQNPRVALGDMLGAMIRELDKISVEVDNARRQG
jgi:hypothetical protein